MSGRGSDPTEPIDGPPPSEPVRRGSSHLVGDLIAILLVLAVGGMVAFGAVRSLVPPIGGAVGASPSPSPTVAPSASITLRPLPSFTATPTPTVSPTPTRTATPTPRATPTPPRTPTPLPTLSPPRTPTPAPTRTP